MGNKPPVGKATGVKKEATTKLPVSEIRKRLGGFKKQDEIAIGKSTMQGYVNEIISGLKQKVKESGLENARVVSKMVGSRYSQREGWFIIGERDYTDAELEKDGMKILAKLDEEKARREKQRKAKVEKFNRLAAELGVPKLES